MVATAPIILFTIVSACPDGSKSSTLFSCAGVVCAAYNKPVFIRAVVAFFVSCKCWCGQVVRHNPVYTSSMPYSLTSIVPFLNVGVAFRQFLHFPPQPRSSFVCLPCSWAIGCVSSLFFSLQLSMLVIRLRTISSETFSTCPIFMSWTLPSCTCSPCRCLHSASIVSASSRSIVVCAEYVEQHQLICLLCVILHVLLPCLFIALLSRLLLPRHLSIHISFFLSSTCSYSYAFSFLIFLPPLSFSLSIPPTYSPSLRSNHIVLVFSLPALALLFCLHFSHLIPFLSTCLTFLATLSRPFLLLFFLPPIFVSCPFSSSLYVIKM